jgi:thioredoxin 1
MFVTEPEGEKMSWMSLFKPAAKVKPGDDACVLLGSAEELDEAIRSRDKLMVLFYASWCPYSQAFLRTFLDHAASGDPCYARIVVDDGDPLIRRFEIDVYPTVLFFEHGQVARRLDGAFHRGLSQGQLEDFTRRCAVL